MNLADRINLYFKIGNFVDIDFSIEEMLYVNKVDSCETFEEVLEQAKRSETAIYSIGLKSDESRSQRGFSEADFVLRQLAQETGGRAFFPETVDELTTIYQQISEELSSQY